MSYRSIGADGALYLYKLYNPIGTLKSTLTAADLSLFSMLNGTGIRSTTPSFSGGTITFTTDRDNNERILFMRDKRNLGPINFSTTETEYENGTKFTSSNASLSARLLLLWCSNSGIGTNADGDAGLRRYIAGVGYLQQTSRDPSATAANTENTYTWSFTAVTPTADELAMLTGISSNTQLKQEVGFGTGTAWSDVQGEIANPFSSWDPTIDTDLVEFTKAIST